MSSYAFLIGLETPKPVYFREDEPEIAYACDWMPVGWLTLFTAKDVKLAKDDPDDEGSEVCPTLITTRKSALSNLRRRREYFEGKVAPILLDYLGKLEAALQESTAKAVQAVLSDIDLYVAHDESFDMLREWVAAMDTVDVEEWATPLLGVLASSGDTLLEIKFSSPQLAGPACIGYSPQNDWT